MQQDQWHRPAPMTRCTDMISRCPCAAHQGVLLHSQLKGVCMEMCHAPSLLSLKFTLQICRCRVESQHLQDALSRNYGAHFMYSCVPKS